MVNVFRLLLFICSISVLASCSLVKHRLAGSSQGGLAPYDVTVEETKNDGHLLQVLAKISSGNRPLVLDDGYLQLKGLNGIDQKVSRIITIEDTFLPQDKNNVQTIGGQTLLAPESSIRCVIDVPSKDLTDYQLELLWSDPPIAKIAIENTLKDGDSCSEPVCQVTYTVDATVSVNRTNIGQKKSVTVALGTVEKLPGVDLKGLIPENEEQIEVPVNAADADGLIPLRVKVVKNVPQGTADQYAATLRVVQ